MLSVNSVVLTGIHVIVAMTTKYIRELLVHRKDKQQYSSNRFLTPSSRQAGISHNKSTQKHHSWTELRTEDNNRHTPNNLWLYLQLLCAHD